MARLSDKQLDEHMFLVCCKLLLKFRTKVSRESECVHKTGDCMLF
jgi:hypothetical protein